MEYSKEEEYQIIAEILDGRKELFRKLVDRHAPLVFHIVRRFEKDEDEAEELAQQIFVKAYERLASFDRKALFSSWLYMLATNHCRDHVKNVRRLNRRFSEMDEHSVDMSLSHEETPDRIMEADQWKKLLEEALDHITADYAQAFLMKYRDEMTYKTMAERLNVTVSALKVRVHRGRKELKEYFQNNE